MFSEGHSQELATDEEIKLNILPQRSLRFCRREIELFYFTGREHVNCQIATQSSVDR